MKKFLPALLSLCVILECRSQAYQKMLGDSVTEFDVNSYCLAIGSKQNSPDASQGNCVNNYCINMASLNAWYVKNDSLYNGKTYKKVVYENIFEGLIREDTTARKVYFIQYCNNYEELLYDFSLLQGDTIQYTFPWQGTYLPSGDYIVDSIRVKHDYSAYYHRHFYLRNHAGSSSHTLELIEGVGCTVHPLFLFSYFQTGYLGYHPTCTGANYDQGLSCKWDNGTKVYWDSCAYNYVTGSGSPVIDSCVYCLGFTGDVNEFAAIGPAEIYPNPASAEVIIRSKAELGLVEIYNTLGTNVYRRYTRERQLTPDLAELPRGIYFVRVHDTILKLARE
jgi:hypothetical protein